MKKDGTKVEDTNQAEFHLLECYEQPTMTWRGEALAFDKKYKLNFKDGTCLMGMFTYEWQCNECTYYFNSESLPKEIPVDDWIHSYQKQPCLIDIIKV